MGELTKIVDEGKRVRNLRTAAHGTRLFIALDRTRGPKMAWVWIAIVLGVLAPWVTTGTTLRLAFEERGPVAGMGAWFGSALITTPIMLAIMWLAETLIFERRYWIRGLPPPHDALSAVGILAAGALCLVVFWLALNLLLRVVLFVLSPLVRWLNTSI